jgi:hypothetical protein
MFHEPRSRAGAVALAVALAVTHALVLGGCGSGDGDAICGDGVCAASETAAECAEDCGCGNGVRNAGEACDGADLGVATCASETGRGGTLGCTGACAFDVSACTLPACGNGAIEDGETCEGADLGGATCDSIGYSGGALACGDACEYDVTGCCTDTCPAGDAACIGDTLRACTVGPAGCLAWEITDCTATNDLCVATDDAVACVCVDRCSADGETQCAGAGIERCALQPDGCFDWAPDEDCAAGGEICAAGPSGPTCTPDAAADDCTDPFPLAPGENVIAWTALDADYLVAQPSCNTSTLDGPDLVLAYTPPEDGFVAFVLAKPPSARQVVVVSSAACGTVEPELVCAVDTTPAFVGGDLPVAAGVTYHFYVRDTTSGTAPLDNPLVVSVQDTPCSAISVPVTALAPANGTSVPDLTPILTADFGYPVDPTTGVITVSGDQGTNLAYDLATGPAEIALVNDGKTLVIDPGIQLPPGETITVGWTGLRDATCGSTIAPPAWTFLVTGPPCVPGLGGMVGTTMTRIPTGVASFTEQFVAVDTNPTGYVYVGGLSNLYRTPKAGGATQDVEAIAVLTATQLGYDMLIHGADLFTLESNTTATSNQLWRISTTGGASWALQNYLQLPAAPNDDLRALAHHGDRLYAITDDTAATEIWSVADAAATLPAPAVLVTTLAGETNCTGLAVDAANFYLACGGGDRLLRVDRATFAVTVITTSIDFNTTKTALHVHDFDGDGVTDALYVSSYDEQVHYVCDPGDAGPHWIDVLVSFGNGTSNFGLGFDPVADTLWMFDDDTRELVSIH